MIRVDQFIDKELHQQNQSIGDIVRLAGLSRNTPGSPMNEDKLAIGKVFKIDMDRKYHRISSCRRL